MVSGLVTSPCDQDMIVSGEASESFRASKFSSFSKCFSLPYLQLLGRVFPELFALEADAEVQRDLGNVFFGKHDLALVLTQDLDPEREPFELLDQHAERFRDAGLERVVALDDGLVGLHPTDDVVGLDGQDLLQDVRGAVSLERPHLHLAEALAAELRLAAQRLLGDEAVRTGRPGVDLVLDQVGQLEHVDHAHGHRLVELVPGAAVPQPDLAVLRQSRPLELGHDGRHGSAVENRRRDLDAERGGDPPKVGLQDLAQVHAARHAERVEHDVDRGAVGQVGHVLGRHDPGDHALVAVAAGHLVTGRDLSLLGEIDTDHLVDARAQLILVLAREHLDVDHDAALAVWDAQARVADLARLLAEDRAEQPLLGRQLGLALGRDLADQDVALLNFGADVDDAALVEVAQRVVGDVGYVTGDLFGTELRLAGLGLVLLDVDRGVHVLLDHALRQKDRVLEVVALPGHERDEHVASERHLAVFDRGPVGEDVALVDVLARLDLGAVVEAGALVGARELLQRVVPLRSAGVWLDDDLEDRRGVDCLQVLWLGDVDDSPGDVGDDHLARVLGGVVLHSRADQRRVGDEQGNRLALHVGAHQGAAGVVVLEERDHGRRHRHDLLRRDVHVLDVADVLDLEIAARPGRDTRVHKVVLRRQRGVGLGDSEHVLLIGRQVLDLGRDPGHDIDAGDVALEQRLHRVGVQLLIGGHDLLALVVERRPAQRSSRELLGALGADRHAVVDTPERGLHETELVDLCVSRQVADKADVRTLRGLDRADAAVVAVVDIANVEPGPLAGQTAWTKRRKAALVGELGQRVVLVHELGQLTRAEELLDRGHHRAGVDERCRCDRVRVTDRHALLDDPLHADQAHPELVLEQLADRAYAAVAEMVDVVRDLLFARCVVQLDQLAQESDEVSLLEDAQLALADAREDVLLIAAQALVDLVPADAAEVEAARVEEEALQQVAGVVDGRRVAWPDAAVQLEEGVLGLHRGVLVERRLHVAVLGVVVHVPEHLQQGALLGFAVVLGALQLRQLERLQQNGHRDLALAVDLDGQQVFGGRLDL